MTLRMPDVIDQIEARLNDLQKSCVALQEQLVHANHDFECFQDNTALKIIDIIDMIESFSSDKTIEPDDAVLWNTQQLIKKIEKRLMDLLRQWKVKKISFENGQIEKGKARVMETRILHGKNPSDIISICREGYQRGEKVIRPADVVTAGSGSDPNK
jgi:molecular chaperone GrpE